MASALRIPAEGWPLAEEARALGAVLSDATESALGDWLRLMVQWNARIDLTAARTTGELVDLMVADALLLAAHVPAGARVVDVGAGAGAPGLALALLRTDVAVTLVEPLAKRTAFLRTVLAALARTDVQVVSSKGEELAGTASAFDVAVSRATLPPAQWLELGMRLVRAGGDAWVFLAKEEPPVCAEAVLAESLAYAWPLTGAARRAVRYTRR